MAVCELGVPQSSRVFAVYLLMRGQAQFRTLWGGGGGGSTLSRCPGLRTAAQHVIRVSVQCRRPEAASGDEIRVPHPFRVLTALGQSACLSDTRAEHECFPQHRPRLSDPGAAAGGGSPAAPDPGSHTQARFRPLYPRASTLSTMASA